MKKREVRLYNMIIPVWLLWMFFPLFPWVLPVTLLGNLLIDTAVLFCALLFLKCKDKGRLLKRLWWRVWLRGFAADCIFFYNYSYNFSDSWSGQSTEQECTVCHRISQVL